MGEAPVCFLPTYGLVPNSTDQYKSEKDGKHPVIGWPDRILWKGRLPVEVIAYTSLRQIKQSDHRPVFGYYKVVCGTQPSQRVSKRKRQAVSANEVGAPPNRLRMRRNVSAPAPPLGLRKAASANNVRVKPPKRPRMRRRQSVATTMTGAERRQQTADRYWLGKTRPTTGPDPK